MSKLVRARGDQQGRPDEREAMPDQPMCSLCGEPVEAWPHRLGEPPMGWGHNPEPLAAFEDRCCDLCNATKVIPARLKRIYGDVDG